MDRRVIGLGAGGHAKVVVEILRYSPDAEIVGLLDRRGDHEKQNVFGVPILGDDSLLPELRARGIARFFVGVGGNASADPRRRLYELGLSQGMRPVAAVHPGSIVSGSASIGAGPTVMAGAIISAAAAIGDNVIVNTGAIVDHDCVLGHHVHVGPGATLTGGVRVGNMTMIGAGATVRPGITIGEGCVIGAGAVVIDAVDSGAMVVGVPARPMRTHERKSDEQG